MNVSILSLRGLSRMTRIPMNNPDLIALADKMGNALTTALPSGHFKSLAYQKVADASKPLSVTFQATFDAPKESTVLEAKDDFEAEFEAEMER